MKRRMSKAEAQAYVARWNLVNEAEREELRTTPMEVKFRQFESLMRMAIALGWTESPAAEEAEVAAVRERWNRLRRAYGV
jgi:hypothetical protein